MAAIKNTLSREGMAVKRPVATGISANQQPSARGPAIRNPRSRLPVGRR